MAESSNGTTFTFNAGAKTDVRTITFTETAEEIDITVLTSTAHLSEAGLTKATFSIETVGISDINVGDTGALAISWNDGGNESLTGSVCLSKEATATLNTEIITTLTFAEGA